ncbi:MAG: hypothetical protein K6E78_03550 [Treponema sp.]|nr:hypothetical protein [Treponema sp.]
MNIYVDESGSINNKLGSKPFIIALIHVLDLKKLNTVFRRFISANIATLKELDKDFYNREGKLTKKGNLMFHGEKFHEIKGSQLNQEMKIKFVNYLVKNKYFELYYIKINNDLLTDKICENTARAFNYSIKLALSFFWSTIFLQMKTVCYSWMKEMRELKPDIFLKITLTQNFA